MQPDLVCPLHRLPLEVRKDTLRCADGEDYRIVNGVAVLVTEDEPTHGWCAKALELQSDEYPAQRMQPGETPLQWVQRHAVATCGNLYSTAPATYPIPSLPDAITMPGPNRRFLEIGSNWGRWCFAAARAGYEDVVGVDPYLPSMEVGRAVARELGLDGVCFVAADGRHLPFSDRTFDVVFSYSVFQHWDKVHVRAALDEASRVLRPGGRLYAQLTNQLGLYGIAKRLLERVGLKEKPDIRYWTFDELRETFTAAVGPTMISADGFFTLNPRRDDLELLPVAARAVVRASEFLKHIPGSAAIADSVWVSSTRTAR